MFMQRVFEMSIKNTEPVFMRKPPAEEKEHLNSVVHLVPGAWQIMRFGMQQSFQYYVVGCWLHLMSPGTVSSKVSNFCFRSRSSVLSMSSSFTDICSVSVGE